MLEGILKGPEYLLRLREDIQPMTSIESVEERNIEFATGFFRKDEKCLEASGMSFLIFSAMETR